MIKRTVGFNWTASGVSTAIWRGVLLRDVLLACGLRETPEIEHWYAVSPSDSWGREKCDDWGC